MTPGAHALLHGAGIVTLPDATWLVAGSQARDFLHRMLSQDVNSCYDCMRSIRDEGTGDRGRGTGDRKASIA